MDEKDALFEKVLYQFSVANGNLLRDLPLTAVRTAPKVAEYKTTDPRIRMKIEGKRVSVSVARLIARIHNGEWPATVLEGLVPTTEDFFDKLIKAKQLTYSKDVEGITYHVKKELKGIYRHSSHPSNQDKTYDPRIIIRSAGVRRSVSWPRLMWRLMNGEWTDLKTEGLSFSLITGNLNKYRLYTSKRSK